MAISLALDAHRLRRGTKTRDWLTVLQSTVNGTELGDQEWHVSLFLRYGIDPPDLSTHCGGCNAKMFICQDLYCNKGVLITTHHINLRYGVADLSGKTFIPPHVRNNPLIHQSRALRSGKSQPEGNPNNNLPYTTENSEQKRDLIIHEIWQKVTGSINGIRVVNTDALSHHNKSQEKCLQKT